MAGEWSSLTKHGSVRLCIAEDPGARLRDIAAAAGITELGDDSRHREATMDSTPGLDDEVLELRTAGQPFTAIAKKLGQGRASEAREAFNRAIRRRPDEVRAALRIQEMGRLDAMAEVFRSSRRLDQEELARRLRAVDQLRANLMGD